MGRHQGAALDQWVWQKRAHRVLGQILDLGRPDPNGHALPAVSWRVGDAGACLLGRLGTYGHTEASLRQAFEDWRRALGMRKFADDHHPRSGLHTLIAQVPRFDGLVSVALVAEYFDDLEQPDNGGSIR